MDRAKVIELSGGPVRPDPEIWSRVRDIVMPLGFRAGTEGKFQAASDEEIGFSRGPEPGIRGVSRITLELDGDELRLRAELGRLTRLRRQSRWVLAGVFMVQLVFGVVLFQPGTAVLVAAGGTGLGWLALQVALNDFDQRARREVDAVFRELLEALQVRPVGDGGTDESR